MPFRTIAGHRRLLTRLSSAVARGTVPQSLLLGGPSGVGKHRIAVAIAEAFNCLRPVTATDGLAIDACGECPSCRRIGRGTHPDVVVVVPGENGEIKIDQVRDVIHNASFRPFEGKRRVAIIDDADRLRMESQNALLKSLEEPPAASVFILVSSLPDALLPTVRSRCTRLRTGRLSPAEVTDVLMREHEYSEVDARAAAADADGSVGVALASEGVDRVAARRMAQFLLEHAARVTDPARRLDAAKELAPTKKSSIPAVERAKVSVCLRALASLLRDVGLLASRADARSLSNADLKAELERLTGVFTPERCMRAFVAVDEAIRALAAPRNGNPKIVADWLVLQL